MLAQSSARSHIANAVVLPSAACAGISPFRYSSSAEQERFDMLGRLGLIFGRRHLLAFLLVPLGLAVLTISADAGVAAEHVLAATAGQTTTATPAATGAGTTPTATPGGCGTQVFTGSLGPSDPEHVNYLYVTSTPTTCGGQHPCPSIGISEGVYRYRNHTLVNTSS